MSGDVSSQPDHPWLQLRAPRESTPSSQEAGPSGAQSIAAHQTTSRPAVSPAVIPPITPVVRPPPGSPPAAFPLTHTAPFVLPPTPTFSRSYPNASAQAPKFKIVQSKAQQKKGATEDDPMVIAESGPEPEERPIPPARVGRGRSPRRGGGINKGKAKETNNDVGDEMDAGEPRGRSRQRPRTTTRPKPGTSRARSQAPPNPPPNDTPLADASSCDTCLRRGLQCTPHPGRACLDCNLSKLKCNHTPLKRRRSSSSPPTESAPQAQASTSSARSQSVAADIGPADDHLRASSPPSKKQRAKSTKPKVRAPLAPKGREAIDVSAATKQGKSPTCRRPFID